MSLPIVIIFERHWDTIPKTIIKDLLPALNKKGYQTFCFEAPQDLSPPDFDSLGDILFGPSYL